MGNRAKRAFKRTCKIGLLGGAAYAAWRWYQSKAPDREESGAWEPQPFPYPPIPRASGEGGDAHVTVHPPVEMELGGGPEIDDENAPVAPWMDPVGGGCPPSHPVKGKLASGIFHLPGGSSYERTTPDRCYLDSAAAEADGLRPAKR